MPFETQKYSRVPFLETALSIDTAYRDEIGEPMDGLIMTLEDGWTLVSEDRDRPLALVRFTRGVETQRARFDIDKKIFLDKIPSAVSLENRERLAKSIAGRAS